MDPSAPSPPSNTTPLSADTTPALADRLFVPVVTEVNERVREVRAPWCSAVGAIVSRGGTGVRRARGIERAAGRHDCLYALEEGEGARCLTPLRAPVLERFLSESPQAPNLSDKVARLLEAKGALCGSGEQGQRSAEGLLLNRPHGPRQCDAGQDPGSIDEARGRAWRARAAAAAHRPQQVKRVCVTDSERRQPLARTVSLLEAGEASQRITLKTVVEGKWSRTTFSRSSRTMFDSP